MKDEYHNVIRNILATATQIFFLPIRTVVDVVALFYVTALHSQSIIIEWGWETLREHILHYTDED